MDKWRYLTGFSALVVSSVSSGCTTANAGVFSPKENLVFKDNFTESPPKFNFDKARIDGNGAISSAGNPTVGSNRSGKFVVPDDGFSYRAEVSKQSLGYGSFRFCFADYLPRDWIFSDLGTVVAQWHGYKLSSSGEDTNPPVSLVVQDHRWYLKIHWIANPDDTKPQQRVVALGEAKTGQWNNWTFDIKWSTQSLPHSGAVAVVLNGQRVADDTGDNNYHQNQAPYFKIGIYRPEWNPAKENPYPTGGRDVTIYDDAVAITQN